MKKRMIGIILAGALSAGLFIGGCGGNLDGGTYSSNSDMSGGAMDDSAEVSEEVMDAAGEDGGLSVDSAYDASESQQEDIINTDEKLIKTYNYSVETKKFDAFISDVTAQVKKLGGYIQESEISGNTVDGDNRSANMTLRIPKDKMGEMLSMVKEGSNVTYQNVSTDDVTLNYVDMESHIQALRTEQETLLRLIEKADKIDDIITLQSQLTEVRYELESYESQLRTMDNLVTYSTMYLDITEVQRTTTIMDAETGFGEEIKNRFSDNLYAVSRWLRSFVIWFIGALPILIPLAAVAAVVVFLIKKRNKKREQERYAYSSGQTGYQSIYDKQQKPDAAGEADVSAEKPEEKDS